MSFCRLRERRGSGACESRAIAERIRAKRALPRLHIHARADLLQQLHVINSRRDKLQIIVPSILKRISIRIEAEGCEHRTHGIHAAVDRRRRWRWWRNGGGWAWWRRRHGRGWWWRRRSGSGWRCGRRLASGLGLVLGDRNRRLYRRAIRTKADVLVATVAVIRHELPILLTPHSRITRRALA